MNLWQIYLVDVEWLRKDVIATITPGKMTIQVTPALESNRYETSIPAYSRSPENGRDVQLAIKSNKACAIVKASGDLYPLATHIDSDTGDTWWLEKGTWKNGYHDASSFHHPGGRIELQIGDDICSVQVFNPSISDTEFFDILEDLKCWCWRMAIDESCYVMVQQNAELKVLSDDFKRLVADFNRYVSEICKLPHCELRESISYQTIERLRPNTESIRFMAQRGERNLIPGRGAMEHYATAENSLIRGMLTRVIAMLKPQEILVSGGVARFINLASQYNKRVAELDKEIKEKVVKIDCAVIDENLRRVEDKLDKIKILLAQGNEVIPSKINKKGDVPGIYFGSEPKCIVDLKHCLNQSQIEDFFKKNGGSIRLIGKVTNKNVDYPEKQPRYEVVSATCDVWRNYDGEYADLVKKKEKLKKNNWEQPIEEYVLSQKLEEEKTLRSRVKNLQEAANRIEVDQKTVSTLLQKAKNFDKTMNKLGIPTKHNIVPSIVFLQSPQYAGALSAFRQLNELTGIDQKAIDDLLSLEEIGIRDWPAIYERWCLVSIVRVLQDDFRFDFNKDEVRERLLKYFTNKTSGTFYVTAIRKDMNLSLKLHYQKKLENGRVPDYYLEILDLKNQKLVNVVIDAKSCNFIRKADNSKPNTFKYLDDCMDELSHTKNYGQDGHNYMYIVHSSKDCISYPTTSQQWASSSALGGDSVFSWDRNSARPKHKYGAVLLRPNDLSQLKLFVLLLIQHGLERMDICVSCGEGGDGISIKESITRAGKSKYLCTCTKCQFMTVRNHCYNCGKHLHKNQGFWTFHDLHPTEIWNTKCWSCGTLL